jgi:hypothetical protein
MAAKPVILLRRFCQNEGCGMPFFICESCERGQCYCSETCSYQARLQKCRGYNRNHQQSPEGRRDHADRQRAYRDRKSGKKMTDHGSIRPSHSGSVGILDWIQAFGAMVDSIRANLNGVGFARCCICGRRGELAR